MEEYMKKSTFFFSLPIAVLIVLGLGACHSDQKAVDMDTSKFQDIHTSRISLNWDGVYTGIIPSADGPGINVHIRLNLDDTFELWYFYGGKRENTYHSKGPFKWNNAENIIILKVKDWPPYYRVGQNKLTQLDMNGKVITSALAENYVLKKLEGSGVFDM
jgi:uncharacterized lipoprotein NlpE involved in copper resistance